VALKDDAAKNWCAEKLQRELLLTAVLCIQRQEYEASEKRWKNKKRAATTATLLIMREITHRIAARQAIPRSNLLLSIERTIARIAGRSRYPGRMKVLLVAVLFAFPLFHSSHAPAVFRTRIDTTAGSFVIETHRDWSPKGADRFYELICKHYYDNSRFFRVVPGRWVQFGIAGDPKVAQAWRHKTIPDDTLKVHNNPDYVAFSNTGA